MGEAVVIRCGGCGAKNRVEGARLGMKPVCGRCGAALPGPAEPVELDGAALTALASTLALPLVVDFWAPWCGPCRSFAPVIEEFARRRAGHAVVAKVNVDTAPEAAARFGVQAVPTVIVLRGGAEVARRAGALPLTALEGLVAAE
jgi:thioredoxin 2